jgi:hypothetical protein
MRNKYLIRRTAKIEERISIIEQEINQRIIELNEKIESLNERDKFSQMVEFIMLLVTAFKLILLGSVLLIPWSAIRDFWVKTSMCGFLVKSTKRFKKTYEKTKSSKEKAEEEAEKEKEHKEELEMFSSSGDESYDPDFDIIMEHNEEDEEDDLSFVADDEKSLKKQK